MTAQPPTTSDFPQWLRGQLEMRRMQRQELARRLGISGGHASRLVTGSRPPTVDQIRHLAQIFAVDVREVYRIAGVFPPIDPPRGRGVLDAIAEDPWLTKEQKELLSRMYDSWIPSAYRVLPDLDAESADEDGLSP